MVNHWLILGVLFLILVPFVSAQSAAGTLFDVWEHIKRLENAAALFMFGLQDLNATVSTLSNAFSVFQLQTNNEFLGIHDTTDELYSKVSETNSALQNFQTQTDQQITALNQTDQNLQGQINGVTGRIDRSQIYEVINNDVNSREAFCEDNDDILLFGYCMNSFLGELPLQSVQFYDTFSDFDMTTNPPWTVLYGNYIIGPPTSGTSAGDQVCASSPSCEAATPTTFYSTGVSIESQIYAQQSGDELFLALTDKGGPMGQSLDNGYMIRAYVNNGSSSLSLYRIDYGTPTLIHQLSGIFLATGTEFFIRAERNSSGLWQFFVDSVPVGSTVLDQIHTAFTHTHTKFDGFQNFDGGRFDNVKVMSLDTNLGASAFKNISNLNAPLGIQCQSNGSARVLCLRQN